MVEIRPVKPEDVYTIALLSRELGYERTTEQVAQWLIALDAEKQMGFVAIFKSDLVGWIEVAIVHHLQSDPFGLIGGLVVKDGIRGLGIGRLLCEQAEAWSWARGVNAVRVTSRSTRLAAHRFYLRDGYRLDKTSLVFEKLRKQ